MTDLKTNGADGSAGLELTAADVMVTEVITVAPETTLQEAARVLLDHRISGLPVVDAAGRVVGVISEGDLLRRAEIGTERRRSWWLEMMVTPGVKAEEFVRSHATRVSDVMTASVVTVAEGTPLREIASLLERHRIKRVPIVRAGRLAGLVSRANILQAFAAANARSRPEAIRDDRTLREAVIRQFKQVPGGMPWIVTVTVPEGVVELRGPVNSPEQKAALRVAAETVPRVNAVNDQLFKFQRAAE